MHKALYHHITASRKVAISHQRDFRTFLSFRVFCAINKARHVTCV
ncbi:Uncharacterised protein [Vibrio cholerae]|nr:Uncharacterised protein [Vibrio cholerae]